MYRLQSGIQATADLAAMSPETIITWGIVAIVVILVAAFVVVKLGITSIGPIKREHKNTSGMYFMNEENRAHDEQLQKNLRDYTNYMRTRIVNSFRDVNMCGMTRRALSSSIRFPLYERIASNHFTEILTQNNGRAEYEKLLITLIKDEYDDLYFATSDMACIPEILPAWTIAKERIEQFVKDWIDMVAVEVIKTCKLKIDTYKRYMGDFAGDKYREKIIQGCIDKNTRYVEILGVK